MKLRNKRTGDIWEFDCIGLSIAETTLQKLKAGQAGGVCFANSLADLNEEWEDYKSAEPLIKDEKIRKAVRAWADANDIRYIEPCARSNKDNYRIVGFNALGRSFTMEISNEYECRITFGQALSRKKRRAYTIAEICGEEDI